MFNSAEDIILFVLAVAVLIVFAGCIYAFFRAIFLFIFSKGEDDKVKAARNSIRYMIIGLVLTIMLLFIGPQLLRLFRLPNADVYTARSVFIKIWEIISGAGGVLGRVVSDYPGTMGTTTLNTSTDRNTSTTPVYQL